jgi:DNA-binding transcriptional LysR family regulator
MLRLLPPVIVKFHTRQPEVRIALRTGVIDTLVPALLGGELDVICSTLDFPSHAEIVKEHLTDIQHMLAASAQHPLAQRDDVPASDLLAYPWIRLATDYVGASRVNSFFAANELVPPRVAVETTSIASAAQSAAGWRLHRQPADRDAALYRGIRTGATGDPRHAVGVFRRHRLPPDQDADPGCQGILRHDPVVLRTVGPA